MANELHYGLDRQGNVADPLRLTIKGAKLSSKDFSGEQYGGGPSRGNFLIRLDQTVAYKMGFVDDVDDPGMGQRALDRLVDALALDMWPVSYAGIKNHKAEVDERIRQGEYPNAWICVQSVFHPDPADANKDPRVIVIEPNGTESKMDFDSIGSLDRRWVDHINCEIRLFYRPANPKSKYPAGRVESWKAYLNSAYVYVKEETQLDLRDEADDFLQD